MLFVFPDSQDMIDPSFDFRTETRAEFRIRGRDDLYAHEVLDPTPFDGILVSKAIVDGAGPEKPGKYSIAQRERLRRIGVKRFFRAEGTNLFFVGDCGAFSYKDEVVPPYTAEEVAEFYDECGFDYGISVDHLVLEYHSEDRLYLPGLEPDLRRAQDRQELTLDHAGTFIKVSRRAQFKPIGVAQGWSAMSYAKAVRALQKMGYRYIALGSMVPLKTPDILDTLRAVAEVKKSETRFHLLGVTRVESIAQFKRYGVKSFDSTSPFLQAFKDNRDNYHTPSRTYVAIRVPQVEGNAKLQRTITAGKIDSRRARVLEQQCLAALRRFDAGDEQLEAVIDTLRKYAELTGQQDRSHDYAELLRDQPWKYCTCAVCRDIGIDVVVFRGSERNKRRGFHNLHVFEIKLQSRRTGSARKGRTRVAK